MVREDFSEEVIFGLRYKEQEKGRLTESRNKSIRQKE